MFKAQYGVAADFYLPVIKAGVKDFAVSADWTPATGDVKVSIDGGNVANVATLPTIVGGTGAAVWKFPLSAAELTGKRITVQVVDSATKAVEDQSFVVETFGHQSANDPRNIVRRATAQAGANGSVTLDASASATDDFYNGCQVEIVGGTGVGQARMISDYTGSSKVAAVDRNWVTNPDSTSVFEIRAGSLPSTVTEIQSGLAQAADVATLLAAQEVYKKNVAVTSFTFPMELTNGNPGTGLTVAGQVSKDGGAFANLGASVTEIGSGWYKVNIAQAEMNADEVALKFTATGAKQLNVKIRTQS